MTTPRRRVVAQSVLLYLLNNDQLLAKKVSLDAKRIARVQHVSAKEVKELLDPWVKYYASKNKSH